MKDKPPSSRTLKKQWKVYDEQCKEIFKLIAERHNKHWYNRVKAKIMQFRSK